MTNSLAFIFMHDKSINISKIDSVAKGDIVNKENLLYYQKIPKSKIGKQTVVKIYTPTT